MITYREVPPDFTEGSATMQELKAAGFHGGPEPGRKKPGQQPLDEFVVPGAQMMTPEVAGQILRAAKFRVLRDPSGSIVATWDEGRWWTPAESDEFTRQLRAEMTGEDTGIRGRT